MDATCYIQKGKAKSELLCAAFAAGVVNSGGKASVYDGDALKPGAAVFYGVRPHQKRILEEAKYERRDWYYIDNAYFDKTREKFFRITRNRLQHSGRGESCGTRFANLKIDIRPWRKSGEHVLVCPQSDEFLNTFCPDGSRWTAKTLERLARYTEREVRVRPWQPNKVSWYRTLPDDLANCWALVTYSSASAITAMLDGIPAFVSADDCISRPVANTDLAKIEQPAYATGLRAWAEVVADNQFSLKEIASGYAWERLNTQVTC